MIAIIDGKKFYIDEKKITDHYRKGVDSVLDKKILIDGRITVDLRSRGLLMTAARQVVSFILPLVGWAAEKVGTVLPERKRHEDVIKYVLNAYFQMLEDGLKDIQVDFITVPYVEDIRMIENFDINTDQVGLPFFIPSGNQVTTERSDG